ncbi:bifunctional diguanylate cyclase/phosphodiesterase [Endothiovibrio diazotrophicus]
MRARLMGYPLLFSVLVLVMAAAVLVWSGGRSLGAFTAYHERIGEHSVQSSASEIRMLFVGIRNGLQMLADQNEGLFRTIADYPDDEELQGIVSAQIAHYFPGFIDFALADADGEVLTDPDGVRVGKRCREEIRRFVRNYRQQGLALHPGAERYHFDVQVPWRFADDSLGVFHVSFDPRLLAEVLARNQVPGHRLFLLNGDREHMIEVSAGGGRDGLAGAERLSAEQVSHIVSSMPVEGTEWRVADLPSAGLRTALTERLVSRGIGVLAGFVVISLIMLALIRREESGRELAEQALRLSHNDLERRVERRTAELSEANLRLHREIIEREQLTQVVEQTGDSVVITNAEGVITYVNHAFEEMTGYVREEVVGRDNNLLKSGRHEEAFYQALWRTILAGESFRNVFVNRRKDGELYYEEKTITPLRESDGSMVHFVATGKDITQRVEIQQRLDYLAHHDELTGLPNRTLLLDRVEHAVAHAHRHHHLVALLFLDLDRFKAVNDSLGHETGDKLLQAVARRLTGCLREGDTVARLGGDEFTVVLEDLAHTEEAATVAEKVIDTLTAPFRIGSHELFIGTSIGIALYPQDAAAPMELLKCADTAMYQAKQRGGNLYQFFTAGMSRWVEERLEMEGRLRHALARREFFLVYQPRVAIADGEPLGMEALLRWDNEALGLVMPGRFIPLLEETGLIVEVCLWILERAIGFRASLGDGPLRMAVNLSAAQFRRGDLVGALRELIERGGIAPHQLELEITESLLMENFEEAAGMLDQFHALGVSIALDDFGTGYASLSYLSRLPIDTLKIDRSFVNGLGEKPQNEAIVRAIIAMGHSLGMRVVAEGVETHGQLEQLRRMGCDEAQGFLFCKPIPEGELREWLAGENAPLRVAN